MTKLRTIIRLYEDGIGLKTISVMARTSRNTVKKYITHWRTLGISYEDFQSRSDGELHTLFCAKDKPAPNPRMAEFERFAEHYGLVVLPTRVRKPKKQVTRGECR